MAVVVFQSDLGRIAVEATERGVSRIEIRNGRGSSAARPADPSRPLCGGKALRRAVRAQRQLKEYLAGRRLKFDLALDWTDATEFQRRVWRACRRIRCGRTCSYAQLAARAGRPTAARAAGHAMAVNPIPIVVPCHRVLRSDGTLGGYSMGLALKRKLLRLEGVISPAASAVE